MSLQLLETLEEARAFESTHRFEDLSYYHVPFDQLTGREETEASLLSLAEHGSRAALVGPSGAGKSSVISAVLGPLTEDLREELVPLRIPVATLPGQDAVNPTNFTRHLLETVVRYSSEILSPAERAALNRSAAGQVSTQGRERSHRISVGAPKLLADASIAAEVKSGAEQFVNEQSSGAAVEGAARLVEVFRSHGREPFFILDDTDRWIRVAGRDRIETADQFFWEIIPLLAREVDCGFVIAVHDQYLELQSYRETRQLMSREIRLPLPDQLVAAIEQILARRIQLAGAEAQPDELLQPQALELLAEIYGENRSLRKVLAYVDRATQLGCTDRVEILTEELIQTALADLG